MSDGKQSLKDANIFQLKSVIKNFKTKKSAFIEDTKSQLKLCLVGQDDVLLFRRSHKENFLKLIDCKTVLWFKNAKKSIQDLCFNSAGSILLVLCYDNTLHTVPLNWVLDNKVVANAFHFSQNKISSFIIPFAGPHECPNSRKCPNNSFDKNDSMTPHSSSVGQFSTSGIENMVTSSNSLYNAFYATSGLVGGNNNLQEKEHPNEFVIESADNKIEENLNPCPYPTSVVWWQTLNLKQSAIIGYSDGSICMVGLEPDCPLIANTSISRGAVVKMVICKDSTMNNVSLMINSSLTEQWKLLLEQKSIGYVYPCEVMSKNRKQKEVSTAEINDWQILVPLNEGNEEDNGKKELKDNEHLVEANGNENYEKFKEQLTSFAIMNVPAMSPEILTTPSGPFFIVQNIRDSYLLSALHSYSDTLSVHSMNITLVPLDIYKIPKHCSDVLVAQNFLYTVQHIPSIVSEPKNFDDCSAGQIKTVNYNHSVGVVSGNFSNICDEAEFNESSFIGHFDLVNETILNIHRVVPPGDQILPQIFKLNVYCFEDLFDWLSLGDLRVLRQICKRLKQVVDYYIKINYPMVLKKMPIRDYQLDYLSRFDSSNFKLLSHIDILTSPLSTPQIESVKLILDRVEYINIESSQIEGDFYEQFLKFCRHIKCLVVSKFRSEKLIGSGNEWLNRQYHTLECIMVHSVNFNSEIETFELKTLFEQNRRIQTFSTTFDFLWANKDWMLETNVQLRQLAIVGACNTSLPMDAICSLLGKLYQHNFYQRLHFTATWIEDQTDLDQIFTLHGLEKLSLKSISIKMTIPRIVRLKVLNIYAYEHFEDFEVHHLIDLEQVYIAFASINDILPFINCCINLKQLVINHLETGRYFKNGIINILALNEQRKQLPKAHKISLYVNEKIFLTHKWTTTIDLDLIELKRIQSCKREQLFW